MEGAENPPYKVTDEPSNQAATVMFENLSQDSPPCIVGSDGEVAVAVIGFGPEAGVLANRIAAMLNGEES